MSNVTEPTRELSAGLRMTLRVAADVLIPRYGKMPAASEIGIETDALDRVLAVRPDILVDLTRALTRLSGDAKAGESLDQLRQHDINAFDALTLAVTGGYYTAKEVWERIGYPGQEYLPVRDDGTPAYLTNRTLERVVKRGPIYRSP